MSISRSISGRAAFAITNLPTEGSTQPHPLSTALKALAQDDTTAGIPLLSGWSISTGDNVIPDGLIDGPRDPYCGAVFTKGELEVYVIDEGPTEWPPTGTFLIGEEEALRSWRSDFGVDNEVQQDVWLEWYTG